MKRNHIYSLVCLILGLVLFFFAWWEFNHPLIVVEWTTSSELDTAGYNLLRREVDSDMDVQVNPELIPASTDPLIGGEYTFEDQTVQPGLEYRYYLEEVETSGQKNRHGPINVSASRGGIVEFALAITVWTIGIVIFIIGVRRKRLG